jgi:monoterpene epsilon-lactone hydrolase
MGVSPEAHEFAEFLASVSAKSSTPGLDLAVVRDIVDSNHQAASEPEGVTYAEVDADGVPALWAIPEGADPDRALLHFHFGGSVTASMHSDRKAAGHIAKAAGARSLVVDFRLAPEHPYPAQLDDAETAYRWLLSQGYEPRNIGSTGHSIGGTLAVMLPLRLLAKGEATPGAIVSVSPWTDLTIQNPSVDANEDNDKMLSRNTLELFRGAWLQDPAVDFTDPQISLVNADLTGLPPTTVHYGEYETLADDGAQLGRRLADFKVTSEVHPMPEGQHSFVLGAGRVPEVDQAIQQMGQWLRKHLGAWAATAPAGQDATPPRCRSPASRSTRPVGMRYLCPTLFRTQPHHRPSMPQRSTRRDGNVRGCVPRQYRGPGELLAEGGRGHRLGRHSAARAGFLGRTVLPLVSRRAAQRLFQRAGPARRSRPGRTARAHLRLPRDRSPTHL